MKHFLRWVSPLILGVIEFYFLRLATDPSRGTEWWPDFNNQLRALLLTILLCYIVDYCLRNIFHKYIFRKEISIGKEYSYITLGLFITTNVTLSITYALGLIELGQPISDYILVNIIYVPLNVLYYTVDSATVRKVAQWSAWPACWSLLSGNRWCSAQPIGFTFP